MAVVRQVAFAFFLGSVVLRASADVDLAPDAAGFRSAIAPFMERFCIDCHDGGTQKGDVRFDTIDPDLVSGKDTELWKDILTRLQNGEMPPEKKKTQPTDAEREEATRWISREIHKHLVSQRGVPGRVVLRRLSRAEYRNTIRDLLGIVEDPARGMGPDISYHGFNHVGEVQELSPSQIREYIKGARRAVDAALPTGPRPITVQYKVEPEAPRESQQWRVQLHGEEEHLAAWPGMKDQNKPKHLRLSLPNNPDEWEKPSKNMGMRIRADETRNNGVLLQPATQIYKGTFGFAGLRLPYTPGETNLIRLRVKAGVRKEKGVGNGILSIHVFRKLLGHFEIEADARAPQWHEWIFAEKDLQKVHHIIKDDPRFHKVRDNDVMLTNGYEHPGEPAGHKGWMVRDGNQKMPRLFIDAIELDLNYVESWPPPTQGKILFDSPKRSDPDSYAIEVLTRFMSRAFRRPVKADELEAKMKLFRREFSATHDFVAAVKEPLISTLASPQFLFLTENTSVHEKSRKPLAPYELATRLSYFLWSSMPDDELFRLSASGALVKPTVLEKQVDRMLADPRAAALHNGFMTQWLRLDKLEELMVEDERWLKSYLLKDYFQEEPARFFAEMVRENLNLMHFIDSDFAVINERLAIHYGIKGVLGPHFRRVALKPEHQRGGLMTMAGPLALTTDGMITSPIYRGVWVLEKILDRPPPPAPANVPPLEDAPKQRLPLREQFARHREDAACAACHKRIDPIGWPFERYGLLGDFHELGHGPNWSYYHDDKRKKEGVKPDMHGLLPDGTKVENLPELKGVFLNGYRDDVVRSVTKHLMIYALGRPLDLSDEPAIEQVMKQLSKKNDGARELIHAIVRSAPFLEK